MKTNKIELNFYGIDLAEAKKFNNILREINKINGCVRAVSESSNHSFNNSDDKMSLFITPMVWGAYSRAIIEWIYENREFLVSLASLLVSLVSLAKSKESKIEVNQRVYITKEDTQKTALKKLEDIIKTNDDFLHKRD